MRKLLHGKGKIGPTEGKEQPGRIIFSTEYVSMPKGNTAAEKRLKILKSKVTVNGKGPEREFFQ